ncbi:CaiB/BaiF CoA transferase family protein [Thalassotalea atypica]|uniref:CaiB/BaiF CoA transferase family protein n=1 Tax=Thalassotalea atypica TaxID=2054316 RepID=UPI002572C48A|nr:CaiB/BaiF CoA-transferase family protein [Thalassotalea atypica]
MPLTSLKILDFSTLLPGPYATMMLSDMGADVLRIESPSRPDLCRHLPPVDERGTSYIHQTLNRSKKSLGLDLKNPEAIELIHRLIADYDIIVEQFRPGVMQRLGLDYNTLKEINPKLIYCSITGYGQTGPKKDKGGHDINYLAIAGLASYTGTPDTGPMPIGFQIADIAGGSMHSVTAILAAVIERSHNGEGQYIDISMTDAAFALNAMTGASALGSGEVPQLANGVLNGGAFYNHYETRDGRYFSVGSIEPQFMTQLCEAIGRPDLVKNGLKYTPESQAPLIEALTEAFKLQDYQHWCEVFENLDACVEPTLNVIEASQHPQLVERKMVVEVPTLGSASVKQIASPIKFSKHTTKYSFTGCEVGHHNDDIIKALGIDDEHYQKMKANGVFGSSSNQIR